MLSKERISLTFYRQSPQVSSSPPANTPVGLEMTPPPLFRRQLEVTNVEMIESSLRTCSFSQTATVAGRNHLGLGGLDPETANITVDLNSEVPIPYPWEQFLNIQTGEVYYLNKANGSKTTDDPRRRNLPSKSDSEPESAIDDDDQEDDTSSDDSSDGNNNATSSSYYSSPSSSSSVISTATSVSSSASTACSRAITSHRREMGSDRDSNVLVLVGCSVCFTLSMVARPGTKCARCGSTELRRF